MFGIGFIGVLEILFIEVVTLRLYRWFVDLFPMCFQLLNVLGLVWYIIRSILFFNILSKSCVRVHLFNNSLLYLVCISGEKLAKQPNLVILLWLGD